MDRETSLSIAHLNKLFLDIKQTSPPLGSSQAVQEQHETRLYNLLPLFCKLFTNNGESSSFEVFEKFTESTAFTQMVSRLMVTEIRRRASNKTTENASVAIVEFLEIQETVNSSAKGWILLSTLNILVSFNSSTLISIMTLNSLASTLVKCLYLFFDLPPCVDSIKANSDQDDDFMTNSERRCLLQKVFSQLLTRLCSSSSALNDLTKKDDLSLLFNAMTSWCPEHNLIWRQTASDVIITMARHGNMNAEHLHSKNCVPLFVENIQRIVELDSASNAEILSMFDRLIQFLSEYSLNVTPNQIHVLLDDFSSSFGYQFLVDFVLRLEQYQDEELLHEVVQIIQIFTRIGISTLKPRPLSVNQLFIIESFSIPKPSQKTSLKNLKAFNVFVSLWTRTQSEMLQCSILDAILNIYKDDKANYFILESQNSLAAFGEKLEERPFCVQQVYYRALEFVVFELNYVPCKELITVGIVLKNRRSPYSMKLCLTSLNRILRHNQVFRDVCREVGLLDIVCSLYSNQIQQLDESTTPEDENSILAELVDFLIQALTGPNNSNCSIFHDCGASKFTFTLISHPSKTLTMKQLRKRSFQIVQQLICSPCGEEILSQLLVLLHSFEQQEVNTLQEVFSLKLSVLKTLLVVLSENHRIRALFRKIGGFVSVMSVIVSMEHCLLDSKPYEVESTRVWNLLRCVFATITTAMRFEPANSKYFTQEICFPSFVDSLRLLGCFESSFFVWSKAPKAVENEGLDFEMLFRFPIDQIPPEPQKILSKSESACLLLRFLYEMSIDILDRSSIDISETISNEIPIVIYPCVVICILNLTQFVASKSLCLFILEKIRRLFTTERNLQVFCDYGFLNELLQNAYADVFQDEQHPLNAAIQYMFEKLSAQHIQPKDLRTFLRLAQPLNCVPLDEVKPRNRPMADKAIPLARIKSIISMSTPRDGNVNRFLLDPPFIEFDMSQEGFSCIFIPSLAPLSTSSPATGASNLLTGAIVGNNDAPIQVIGGIGTGERTFPSQSGLSFTTWIFVKNSLAPSDHPIGLLTLYRSNPDNQDFSCFQITVNPKERTITISTQEAPIFANSKNVKSAFDSDHNIRFAVPELFDENWHHITVILNRALLKNSTISVWIDAKLKIQQKFHYISSIVGGQSGIANTSPLYVNGFIGTPPHYRRHCGLVWKQGPCHLIEEPLHPSFVGYIFMLGPNYIGSFQAINYLPSHLQLSQQQQISEDRLIFGLNSRATSIMTLSKMRRVYSKFDCKQIAKIIGLSTHENATPIYVLHNSSGHLCGPSRPLGGILIGNVGARCFVPKQISLTLSDVGGIFPLLGLVATTNTAETLYASVKSLVCVLRTNTELQLEMERKNGFQTLSVLLKRKREHLNSNILHLIFELVEGMNAPLLGHTAKSVYMNIDHNFARPSNFRAFKELLVDCVDLWFSVDLLKTLLEHFNDSLNENLNITHLREMKLLSRLINICKEQEIEDEKTRHLVLVICFKLLNQTLRAKDLLYFGQFIASLIPVQVLPGAEEDREYSVQLRNSFLKVALQLMSRNNQQQNVQMQEDLIKVLGFDWILLCLREKLNQETVTIGLVNLMIVLSNPSFVVKFKQGLVNGGWLKDANLFVQNKANSNKLLGFNIPSKQDSDSQTSIIQGELFTLPGFQHLNWLLSNHVHEPKVYFILFQAVLGEFKQLTPTVLERIDSFEELNFDFLFRDLFANRPMKNFKQEELYLKDLVLSLFSMVHDMIVSKDNDRRNVEYSKECINFVKYLYENNRDLRFWCQTNFEFLACLCRTMLEPTAEPETEQLTQHPARRLILNFILTIFINIINTGQTGGAFPLPTSATSMFSSQKPTTIFDNLLLTFQNCKLAQTELISLFMDHVMNSQEMNQNASLPEEQPTSVILNFNHSFANIVLIMGTIVDKLWLDCYVTDRKKILECLVKLLKLNFSAEAAQNASGSKLGLQQNLKSLKSLTFQLSEVSLLYKYVNRTVLYLISRQIGGMSDRMFIFEVLQLIYSERAVIIANKNNSEAEFFIGLTHCLLQLIDEEAISLSVSKRKSTWYVTDSPSKTPVETTDEGAMLIASIAKKIWNEIYLTKKQLLEDTLKINLSANQGQFGVNQLVPDISQLRDLLYESTLKSWHSFIDTEQQRLKKRTTTLSFDLPNSSIITEKFTNINRFNSLVSKSAGGLVSKFVGGSAVGSAISSAVNNTKKEVFRTVSDATGGNQAPIPLWTILSKGEVLSWTSVHLSIVNSYLEHQSKQKRIYDQHLRKYVFTEWLNDQYEFLTRERALWGPTYGSKRFDKWMLDMTEGPNRMRKKFIRNDQFYLNYPYRPEFDSAEGMKLAKFKAPISIDSKDYFKRIYSEKYLQLDNDEESFELEICEFGGVDSPDPVKRPPSRTLRTKSSSDCEEMEEFGDVDEIFDVDDPTKPSVKKEDDTEMQTILRLLEEGEKISYMFRVARIQGLDSFEGLLLFGKEHFYLVDGFTLLKSKEIRDIDSLPSTIYEPIVPNTNGAPTAKQEKPPTSKKVCNKFAFEDIREVHKRRYLLQPIALEVFSADGRNTLMVFPRQLRNKVYTRFSSLATQTTDSAQESLMGQKKSASVESGGIFSGLGLGETSVTQRWTRGEISNFQYLMHLNTLAGRSYNDLMQYPVFPWILADYDSPELDLSSPITFRDLSKPMGAQTPARLEQFKKRFSEFEADARMAKSTGDDLIQGAYHYGTFYSSAMIVASYLVRIEPFSQHFLHLQGGHFDLADRMFHSVGDAWHSASKNNMADLKELIPEFFYLPDFLLNSNRFDFGCKQNGTRLDNVILPPWAKGDSREFIRLHREALECDFVSAHLHEWIDLIFGFKQNGPAAVDATNVFHHLFYEGNVDIYSIDDPLKKNATIGFINNFGQIPKQLFKKPHPAKRVFSGTGQSMAISMPGGFSFGAPSSPAIASSKAFIHHLDNLKPSSVPVKECKGAVGQIIQAADGKTLLAVEQNKVLLAPNFNRYIAWGFADHSLRIGPYESDRALYVWESELFPPNGEILCATVPNARLIITAGTNAVVNVWRFKSKGSQLGLIQKLYGHNEAITCLTSSSSFGIIVSGSRDKTCILWDLNRLVFIRQLGGGPNLIHQNPIASVAINDLTGDIATCCSTMLYLWSINGQLVGCVNTLSVPGTLSSQQNTSQILCLAFSTYNEWDSNNAILTGSSDGVVRLWSVEYAQEKIVDSGDDTEKDDSQEDTSSSEEDNGRALNPSKDEIVRRLSTVSLNHAADDQQNSSEDSATPVDQHQPNEADWDILNSHELGVPNISHSNSFLSQNSANSGPKSASMLQVPQNVASLRNSKSDTALVDSFVVVSGSKQPNPDSVLKPGYQWTTKLIFRSRLTMHTAFERKDNREPAAVTCISISKDHRAVFVGDARGRIWSWSVNESGKPMSDHWVKDEMAVNCSGCSVKFTLTERKHHCRQCGLVFCSKCSRFEAPIPKMKMFKPVRVCEKCFHHLKPPPSSSNPFTSSLNTSGAK